MKAHISRKNSSECVRQNPSRLRGFDRGAGSGVEGSIPKETRRPEACELFIIVKNK